MAKYGLLNKSDIALDAGKCLGTPTVRSPIKSYNPYAEIEVDDADEGIRLIDPPVPEIHHVCMKSSQAVHLSRISHTVTA